MGAKIRVIDFESTGEAPPEHGLVEIAFHDLIPSATDLAGEPALWEVVEGRSRLTNPLCRIPPETAAVHHIIDEDVAGTPDWRSMLHNLIRQSREEGVTVFAGHGVKFEKSWFHPDWWGGEPPLPFVCTYKTALRVWPDSPLHSNMGLRYWRMPAGLDRDKGLPAHRAGPDAYVTAFLLRDLLNNGTPLEQMIEWSDKPALLLKCKIGKYRNGGSGTPWEEVDDGMLEWILGKDFDEDTVFTVRHHLDLRAEAERRDQEQRDLDEQFAANGLGSGFTTDIEQESLPL